MMRASAAATPSVVVGFAQRVDRAGRTDILDGQIENERAALVRRAAKLDFAAEQICQFAADGQSQSGSAVLSTGAGVRLLERFENDLLLFEWDADARVGDFERHYRLRLIENRVLRAPAPDRGGDVEPHAAVLGELEGVGQQILEHLLQALGVGRDSAPEVLVDLDVEGELPVVGLVPERPRDGVEEVCHRDFLRIHGDKPPRLHQIGRAHV